MFQIRGNIYKIHILKTTVWTFSVQLFFAAQLQAFYNCGAFCMPEIIQKNIIYKLYMQEIILYFLVHEGF